MVAAEKKYALDELQIGMEVSESQLSEIYDMHIILIGAYSENNEIKGNIGFIGKELTKKRSELCDASIPVYHIYNDKYEADGDIDYEE